MWSKKVIFFLRRRKIVNRNGVYNLRRKKWLVFLHPVDMYQDYWFFKYFRFFFSPTLVSNRFPIYLFVSLKVHFLKNHLEQLLNPTWATHNLYLIVTGLFLRSTLYDSICFLRFRDFFTVYITNDVDLSQIDPYN